MMRRVLLILCVFSLSLYPILAQEGLNLPTELYVLVNEGRVDRYGLGTEGVISATPADQFVIDFGASPDGDWLAYRLETGLVIANVLTQNGELVDSNAGIPPMRGDGASIAWSPDTRKLAYTANNALRVYFRLTIPPQTPTFVDVTDSFQGQGFAELVWSPNGRYLAARSVAENIWQVYQVENNAVTLVSIVPPAADVVWLSSDALLFAPLDGGLTVMDLAQANAQIPLIRSVNVYDVLYVTREGIIQAFRRTVNPADDSVSGQYVTIDPNTTTITDVGTESIDFTLLRDVRWTPDGAFVTAVQSNVLLLFNPLGGVGFPLPTSGVVAYGWGEVPLPVVEGYAVPQNLFFIAPDDNGVRQMWQVFRDATPPLPLTRAESDVTGYTLSPDGFTVAYSSDSQLWLQRLNDGSEPIVLADLRHNDDSFPDFSPDGQTLAYTDGGIWMVPTIGGEPSLLLPDNVSEETSIASQQYSRPRYAVNFGAMLVDILYAEGSGTGLLDINSGELRELFYGYQNARWLYDGRILTFATLDAFSQAGAQITPFNDLETPQIILPNTVSVTSATLIPQRRVEDLRVILDGGEAIGPYPLQVYNFRDGAGLTPLLEQGFMRQPKLSPDGTVIAGLVRARRGDDGYLRGQLTLLDVASGEQVRFVLPMSVSHVTWQR